MFNIVCTKLQEHQMLPPNVVSLSALITASASEQLWLPSMRMLEKMRCLDWPRCHIENTEFACDITTFNSITFPLNVQ